MSNKETGLEQDLEDLEKEAEREIEDKKPGTRRSKKKTALLFLIFTAFIAAVVIYTAVNEFSNKPPEKLGFVFGPENYALIAAGFGCMFLTLAIETVKYLLMMKALGERVSIRVAFETAALGKYYDNITPSGIGGQPFQIYNIHKAGYSNGVSAAMPLTAFLTMQSGFIVLAILVFIFKGDVVSNTLMKIPAYIGVVTYSIVPGAIIIFTISERAGTALVGFVVRLGAKIRLIKRPERMKDSLLSTMREYRASVKMINSKRGLMPLLFVLSFFYQVATCSIAYFVLRAYNGTTGYIDVIAMTVFVYCSITFIPTPGNSGAAEGSFYIIFSELDPTGLFWSMLIWRVICYYAYIAVGFIIYGIKGIEAKIKESKNEGKP